MSGTTRITRSATLSDGSEARVERSALGQAIDYDVYVVTDDSREYKGGGTKREAQRLYDAVVAADKKGQS